MAIVYDEAKRRKTLRERGLDFADAEKIFARGTYIENIDDRFDYGEDRYVTIGLLDQAPVVLVWTPRGIDKRIISMRKANAAEAKRFFKVLG